MAGGGLEQLHLLAGVPGLAVALDQQRLVIEHVALAGRAGHEELDHALGPGTRSGAGERLLSKGLFAAEELGQGDAAEPAARAPEQLAATEVGAFRAVCTRLSPHRGTRCC